MNRANYLKRPLRTLKQALEDQAKLKEKENSNDRSNNELG